MDNTEKRNRLPLPRETERLILRTPLATDAVAIQEAIEESFADLHVWMDWATTLQSLEVTEANQRRHQANYEAAEDFTVSAFRKDSGRYVLGAGLHPRNWKVPSFEIGYWCRTSMQGNGYVTEVVKDLTAAAFRDMAAGRVEIRCDSRNQRSRRVAERAGFRLEAILRSHDRANDGSMRDTTIYVLLAEDFESWIKNFGLA
jgi:RimJ/RimL family protein N-acetyltransferase